MWEEALSLPFDCVGDMRELVFVRFAVKEEGEDEKEPLAVYCISLGSLQQGVSAWMMLMLVLMVYCRFPPSAAARLAAFAVPVLHAFRPDQRPRRVSSARNTHLDTHASGTQLTYGRSRIALTASPPY